MNRNQDILKIILVVLTGIFLMLGAAVLLLNLHRSSRREELERENAQAALDKASQKETPTPSPAISPTPTVTVTPTPTAVPTSAPSFSPPDYLGLWYSRDGLVTVDVYSLNLSSVSFFFCQASDREGTRTAEADVTAEVAGNAAQFTFTDSFGSTASGSMIFDSDGLYVDISAVSPAQGVSVSPNVSGLLTREAPAPTSAPTPTPAPTPDASQEEEPSKTGDYFFPDSDSRYLTDEEVSQYSSSELELAKNEIYARHGRKFVTQRISDYFNSKSWYHGTIDPEVFDSQQDIFNEYELANISKIAWWEEQKREEGN